jgi:D-alanyl-D-alanine carboxypeptidase/D-alanyl-D-alanine-endopeptidase (penicillin-binding protein 4)
VKAIEGGKIGAQVLAGYIHARSGRWLAYALYVNDAGAIEGIPDVRTVIDDEAAISTIIRQSN